MASFLMLVRTASRIPALLAAFALFALMLMAFFDVILRSAFNAPIEAGTELTRILMVITVFSVLPIISSTDRQIAVDLADQFFQLHKLSRYRDALVYLASGIMLIWPIKRIWVLAERTRDYGDVTEYLAIPQYLIGWFIAVATGVAAIAMVIRGLLHLLAPKLLERAK